MVVVFVKECSPFFCFSFPSVRYRKQKASHHVVLAPWRSGPVGTIYNPLLIGSEFKFHFFLFFKECSLIGIERDPSTSHSCTTAPSTRHSGGSASTVAYAGSSSASPPWPTHPGREAYPDRKKQGTYQPVRSGIGLLLKTRVDGARYRSSEGSL